MSRPMNLIVSVLLFSAAASSGCDLIGQTGPQGEPGLQGDPGPRGEPGETGAAGPTGPAGASVETRTLGVGHAQCPWGGSEIVGTNGTTYACHGAPGDQPTQATNQFLVQLFVEGTLAAVFADFDGLTSRTMVIEYTNGDDPQVNNRSGRISADEIVLRRGVAATDTLHSWHENVAATGYDTRGASLLFIDGSGAAVARFDLIETWPRALLLGHGDAPGTTTYLESMTLVVEHITRYAMTPDTPSDTGPVVVTRGLDAAWGSFERVHSLGDSITPIEFQDGDYPILQKRPGRITVERARFVRALNGSVAPWEFREDMLASGSHVPDLFTVSVRDGGGIEVSRSRLIGAWPFAIRIYAGPDGRLMEEVSFAANDYDRSL